MDMGGGENRRPTPRTPPARQRQRPSRGIRRTARRGGCKLASRYCLALRRAGPTSTMGAAPKRPSATNTSGRRRDAVSRGVACDVGGLLGLSVPCIENCGREWLAARKKGSGTLGKQNVTRWCSQRMTVSGLPSGSAPGGDAPGRRSSCASLLEGGRACVSAYQRRGGRRHRLYACT